ncbi:MAG: (5-formylfuran-3-yl)methyl phosphate synthase [Pirellulaceae bacterium]
MKLLISVRNLREARLAVTCHVDVVDLKEPDNGSLGAVSGSVANEVATQLAHRCPLSLALGEIVDVADTPDDSWHLSGFTYAKIGLAGCAPISNWQETWQGWCESIRTTAGPVAVAYADFRDCAAPHPQEVVSLALSSGAAAFLMDTYHKGSGNLLDFWNPEELQKLVAPLKDSGVPVALAGSLDLDAIRRLYTVAPDIVAVRGAACAGGNRVSRLSPRRIHQLQRVVQGTPQLRTSTNRWQAPRTEPGQVADKLAKNISEN